MLSLFLSLPLQGKGEQTLTATMAKAAVKTAQDAAAALCVKVDAGTATADEMNTIRTQKKVVYDVSYCEILVFLKLYVLS